MASRTFAQRKSECLAPPVADDPVATRRLREECESRLRKSIQDEFRQKQLAKMKSALCAKREATPDLACRKDETLPQVFESLCIQDCQTRLPRALHAYISGCSVKDLCQTQPSSEFMQSLAVACGAGAVSQGKKKWNEIPALSELPQKAYELAKSVNDFRFPEPKAMSSMAVETSKHVIPQGWAALKRASHYSIHDLLQFALAKSADAMPSSQDLEKMIDQSLSVSRAAYQCLTPKKAFQAVCYVGLAATVEAGKEAVGRKGLGAVSAILKAEKIEAEAMRLLSEGLEADGIPESVLKLIGGAKKSFQELPNTSSFELPSGFKKVISQHGIAALREKYGSGKGLEFQISNYYPDGGAAGARMGERVQAQFVQKTLKEIFPDATFANGIVRRDTAEEYAKWKAANPGKKKVFLNITDSAEWNEKFPGYTLEMSVLKSANPGTGALPHKALRPVLGIPEDDFVVSIYAQLPGGGLKNQQEYVPSAKAMIEQLMKSGKTPDIVFLSAGGKQMMAGTMLKDEWKDVGYEVVKLSEFASIEKKKGVKLLVVNDLAGKMPYVYNTSDLAIVSGPINMFEPINSGAKTVFFDNPRIVGTYGASTFKAMADTAEATGGAGRIKTLSELPGEAEKLLGSHAAVTPPYLAKAAPGGSSAADSYLSDLEEKLELAMKRTNELETGAGK